MSKTAAAAAAAEVPENPGSTETFAPEHEWSVRKPRVVGGVGGGRGKL
jgi:hypothetical protein